MPKVSLKNRSEGPSAGPRAVIDIKGVHHSIPVDGQEDGIEVDDHTADALAEGSEAGGDLEVVSGATRRKSAKDDEPRAKLNA